jgi:CheY-like chemotaxis protein
LTPKQLKAVKVIESSSDHLLALINDILDVAQIEAGQFNLYWENVPLQSLCEASIQMVYEEANKKGIKINKQLDATVTTIQGDNRRLKQILVNLLNNAVKFTPEGGEIGLEIQGDLANEMVNIVIWDTGIGISKEGKQRLFGEMNRPKPFHQLENTLSRQYQGSGLGLVLVFTLTAMHNGSIKIESKPGKGTRMTVSLPITNGIRPSLQTTQPAKKENNSSIETANLRQLGQRILLAEDNQYTVDGLVDYLTHLGFEVIVAGDGEQAVQKAAEIKPDLIIMDIQLPKLNGLDAIKIIRFELGMIDTPIIALTALTMPGDKERFLHAGANEYIKKPFSLRQITEVISRYSALKI